MSGTSEVSPPKISGIPEESQAHRVPERAQEERKPLSFATPNPWSAQPREVYVGKGRGKKEGAWTGRTSPRSTPSVTIPSKS